MAVQHKFKMGTGAKVSAVKQDENLREILGDAVDRGSDLVHNLFLNDLSKLNQFYSVIATSGESIWINGTDTHTGFPTWSVVDGDSILTIGVYFTEKGKSILRQGTDSVDSFQDIGFAYITLITGSGTKKQSISQVSTNIVQYAGKGIPKIEAGDGLKNVIKNTVSVVKQFVKRIITLAFESGTTSDPAIAQENAASNAEKAAKEASVQEKTIPISEGETIAADVDISVVDVIGLVFSLGTLALTIILNILSKKIRSFVRFYNLTRQNLEFSICWIKEDVAVAVSPMLPQNPITIPKISPAWTPPWIIGSDPISYIDIVFANTDKLKGVGYVLKARPNGDFPGFNVMINIPNSGDNSLQVSFDTNDNCYSYWQDNKDKDTKLTMSATSRNYTLKIATNQVKGESPSPVNGAEGYNYEHLVILEEFVTNNK
ncbi:MAG: hypothetical protein AB4426_28845 [Xenococcaceae cyanobacterium]